MAVRVKVVVLYIARSMGTELIDGKNRSVIRYKEADERRRM